MLQLLVVSYLTHSYWHAKAGWGRGRICIYNQNTSEITVTSSALLVFQQSDRCRSILTQKQKEKPSGSEQFDDEERGKRWWLSKAGKRREWKGKKRDEGVVQVVGEELLRERQRWLVLDLAIQRRWQKLGWKNGLEYRRKTQPLSLCVSLSLSL